MKFALMQPYFFPYLGYFSLIHSVDHFMFFDDIQFTRKSWMSRNRLLNISQGKPFYIRPELIKPRYRELLLNVKLDDSDKWKKKIILQMAGYKRKANFYKETLDFVEGLLLENYQGLADFNITTVSKIGAYLRIETKIDKYTDYNFRFEEKPGIGDWGRVIASHFKASQYINSSGGESFILPEKFTKLGMKLGFIEPRLCSYWQGGKGFFSGLSIIDVLMFNGRDQTAEMIKDYRVNLK